MVNFLYDFTTTWVHILLGFSMIGIVCLVTYYASSAYYRDTLTKKKKPKWNE